MKDNEVVVRETTWAQDQHSLSLVRIQVFVKEQSVAQDLELDGQDATAVHFLATIDDEPIGTSRLLPSGQIGRMAVLREHRSQGIGGKLLHATVTRAIELNYTNIYLNAQLSALVFYERHGFRPYGDPFEEANMVHQAMKYVGLMHAYDEATSRH